MSSDLHEILARLPFLTHAEMDQVAARIKSLRGLGPMTNGKTEPDNATDQVLDVVARIMQSNFIRLKKSRHYRSFQDKIPDLMVFLRQISPKHIERMAVLTIGIELLHEETKTWTIPSSDTLIMNNIHRIPDILDMHFPGYGRGPLLAKLVRKSK